MTRYKFAMIAVAVIFLGVLVFFGMDRLSKQSIRQSDEQAINFQKTGVALKNNPGLKPGVWYLSYEQPGSPGLTKELRFSEGEDANLLVGQRVNVEGREYSGVVQVSKLEILNAYKNDLIWVDSPLPHETVSNPATIKGWARGYWYFEASFPVKILDANGTLIGQTTARAQSNWMTSDYVQFISTLSFSAPSTGTGTLVLERDNPSGSPANADELRVPIKFGVEQRKVKLYYYNPNKDKDAQGNILCSEKGLVAVDREIPMTPTPIQDTVKLLLKGEISEAEKQQGITSEFPLPEFELLGASLANKTLTLEFKDPQNKTAGGSCRVKILWDQIQATAKQYPGIEQVNFKPEDLFQP